MFSRYFFFFSSRRRHTRFDCDWSSDVCSSDLAQQGLSAGPLLIVLERFNGEITIVLPDKEAEPVQILVLVQRLGLDQGPQALSDAFGQRGIVAKMPGARIGLPVPALDLPGLGWHE